MPASMLTAQLLNVQVRHISELKQKSIASETVTEPDCFVHINIILFMFPQNTARQLFGHIFSKNKSLYKETHVFLRMVVQKMPTPQYFLLC